MAQQARPKVIGHSEPERAQLKSLSSEAMTTLSSNLPSSTPMIALLLPAPACRSARDNRCRPPGRLDIFGLYPRQVALGPNIGKPHDKNGDEYQTLEKGERAKLFEHNSPGKEKYNLHIEDDENQRDNVKSDVELDPRRTLGLLATFI